MGKWGLLWNRRFQVRPWTIGIAAMTCVLLMSCSDPVLRADRNLLDEVGLPKTYRQIKQYEQQDSIFRQYLVPPSDADPSALKIPATFTPFVATNSLDNYTRATGWKPLGMWNTRAPSNADRPCSVGFELAVDISRATRYPELSPAHLAAIESGRSTLVRLTAGCER